MTKRCGMLAVMLMTLILSIFAPMPVKANSTLPPNIEITVMNAPEDLILTLIFSEGESEELRFIRDELKTVYYYFNYDLKIEDFDNMKLKVTSKDYNFIFDVPSDTFVKYDNRLVLDLNEQSLKLQDRSVYIMTVILMRVILTLIIEGAFFCVFGYQKLKSWLIFLFTNLFTQGVLNYLFTVMVVPPDTRGYFSTLYVLVELFVIVFECLIFSFLVNEHSRQRGFKYALYANLTSLILGGAIMAMIPY